MAEPGSSYCVTERLLWSKSIPGSRLSNLEFGFEQTRLLSLWRILLYY